MAHAGGRPTKYKPEFCQDIIDFFSRPLYITKKIKKWIDGKEEVLEQDVPNETPFLIKWTEKIGVSHDAPCEWAKVHPEFSDALYRAKRLQESFLVELGIKGDHNGFMTFQTLKNVSGWRDEQHLKQQVDVNITQYKSTLNERLAMIGAN